MIIAQTLDRPQLVTPTEATHLETESYMVPAIHYKSSVDEDTQMSRQNTVEQYDDEMVAHD